MGGPIWHPPGGTQLCTGNQMGRNQTRRPPQSTPREAAARRVGSACVRAGDWGPQGPAGGLWEESVAELGPAEGGRGGHPGGQWGQTPPTPPEMGHPQHPPLVWLPAEGLMGGHMHRHCAQKEAGPHVSPSLVWGAGHLSAGCSGPGIHSLPWAMWAGHPCVGRPQPGGARMDVTPAL